MKRTISLLLTLLLLSTVVTGVFAGAGNRTGSGGAAELLIPVGTRDLAMGGSTISSTRGIEALYWNPAGTARLRGSAALYFSHMSYIADIGVDYGAASVNFEDLGVLSLSVKSLSIGDIVETTTQNPDGTGKTFSPQFFTVGLSYSRELSDRVAVGVTSNFVSERMGEVSASGVAFNVGVIYDNLANVNGLSMGVVVKNIGPQMKFDGPGLNQTAQVSGWNRGPTIFKIDAAAFELPSTLEFGFGYKRTFEGDNSILLSTSFQNNNFSDDEYKVGAEYAYQDLLFLRGGYNFSQAESESEYIFGATFGAGIHYAVGNLDLTFDYAFRSAKIFDNNHIFSVKLGF
jgi:hypothetical protein